MTVTGTAASNVVFAEFGWNPPDMEQAIDRAHRIGQDKPVTGYRMAAVGTIDEDVLAIIDGKYPIIMAATDGAGHATQAQMFAVVGANIQERVRARKEGRRK